MGRTPASEKIRSDFLNKLKDADYSVDISLRSFNSEVYRISKGGQQWIIFLKISAAKPHWWGVNHFLFDFFQLYENKGRIQNIKFEDITNEQMRQFIQGLKKTLTGSTEELIIVLLQPFKNEPRGYSLRSKDFNELRRTLKYSKAGEYKIHEKELEKHNIYFLGLDDLFT